MARTIGQHSDVATPIVATQRCRYTYCRYTYCRYTAMSLHSNVAIVATPIVATPIVAAQRFTIYIIAALIVATLKCYYTYCRYTKKSLHILSLHLMSFTLIVATPKCLHLLSHAAGLPDHTMVYLLFTPAPLAHNQPTCRHHRLV